jgi:hypothetical protein
MSLMALERIYSFPTTLIFTCRRYQLELGFHLTHTQVSHLHQCQELVPPPTVDRYVKPAHVGLHIIIIKDQPSNFQIIPFVVLGFIFLFSFDKTFKKIQKHVNLFSFFKLISVCIVHFIFFFYFISLTFCFINCNTKKKTNKN